MMYLNEFLDVVPPRIIGGDKYSYTCYGDNARFLDMERNVGIVFDEQSHVIYEISIREGLDEESTVWRDSSYEPAYLAELKHNRQYTDDDLDSKKSIAVLYFIGFIDFFISIFI